MEKEIRSKEETVKEIEGLKNLIIEVSTRLDGLKEELVEVEELEKNKVWKPQEKEFYWYIEALGNMVTFAWVGDAIDKWNYTTGNYFKTEEEAERRKFELELEGKARLFQLENNEEIDWEDRDKEKFYIYYDVQAKAVIADWCVTKIANKLGYFSSRELAGQFKNENNEDLIKYFEGLK